MSACRARRSSRCTTGTTSPSSIWRRGALRTRPTSRGSPQTSGLLSTGYGDEVYVYFADNYTPGSLRVIRDKPGQTALADPVSETYTSAGKRYTVDNCAPVLFTPQGDLAQYCIASPIVDKDGTIYMKNDSNHLFAIGSKVLSIELVQEPDKTRYDAERCLTPPA